MKTRYFVLKKEDKERINKILSSDGIEPMDKDENSRETPYGTIYLTEHLPEHTKEDGYTFELEDMESSLWPKIIEDEGKYEQGKQRGWFL